jgi:hypothetical protein
MVDSLEEARLRARFSTFRWNGNGGTGTGMRSGLGLPENAFLHQRKIQRREKTRDSDRKLTWSALGRTSPAAPCLPGSVPASSQVR